MSAAGAAAAPAPSPNWFPAVGWARVPHSFFKKLFRVFSQVELGVLGNILDDTVGAKGCPEWTQISQAKLATLTQATVSGVAKALDRLEELGAIQCRKSGRNNEYRVLVQNWDRIKPKAPRKLTIAPKPEPEAGEGSSASFELPQPMAALRTMPSTQTVLVVLPGQQAKPLSDVCPRAGDCELLKQYAVAESAMANKKHNSADSKGLNIEIPTPEYGYSSVPIPTLESGCSPRALEGEFRRFHSLLSDTLTVQLQSPPPLPILETQFSRLEEAGVSVDYFGVRLGLRKHKFQSWAFLSYIVDDCVKAHENLQLNADRISAAEDGGLTAAKVKLHLRECITALRKHKGNPFRDVAALLEDSARDADNAVLDLAHLELHLDNCEAMIRSIAEQDVLSGEQKSAIDGAVETVVRPYRKQMSATQLAQLQAQVYGRVLWDRLNLRRLSLFYAS